MSVSRLVGLFGLLECGGGGGGLLPLQHTHVNAKIFGVCAEVHIQQRYFNHQPRAIECLYRFPLDENSTVVGMDVTVGGVRVVGEVKEKVEARREYEAAKAAQHTGVLVEEDQSNDFECMIGTFPPHSACEVTIVYITTLAREESGGGSGSSSSKPRHRFVLPAVLAPKYEPSVPVASAALVGNYVTLPAAPMCRAVEPRSFSLLDGLMMGAPAGVVVTTTAPADLGSLPDPKRLPFMPQSVVTPHAAAARTTLFVNVDVVMPTAITYLGSTSHALRVNNNSVDACRSNFQLGRSPDAALQTAMEMAGQPIEHLDRDVVVLIEEAGADLAAPRAMIEYNGVTNSYAMQIAFNPPAVDLVTASQLPCELIFVLDRSGSMGGSSISALRDAMKVLLHSLPASCKFNIVGFGSTFSLLFPTSVLYNNATLQKAIAHITRLEADLGGTEILAPLEYIHQHLPYDARSPRQLFLLTDGKVSNVDACVSFVHGSMASNVRMFTFGIGNGVDRNLVRKLATAAHGECEFITSNEVGTDAFAIKIMTQLQRALQPSINNLRIDWSPFSSAGAGVVVQAPSKLAPIFAQSRAIVYALNVQLPSAWQQALAASNGAPQASPLPPLKLDVSGECNHPSVASGLYRHSIEVTVDRVQQGSFVHRLAAREKIKEWEEEMVLHTSANNHSNKSKIIQLALQYQLSSRFTSFIAVHKGAVVVPACYTAFIGCRAWYDQVTVDRVSNVTYSYAAPLSAGRLRSVGGLGGGRGGGRGGGAFAIQKCVSRSSSIESDFKCKRSSAVSASSSSSLRKSDGYRSAFDERERCSDRESELLSLPAAPRSKKMNRSTWSSSSSTSPTTAASASYSSLLHHQNADGWFDLSDALLNSVNAALSSRSLPALSKSALVAFCTTNSLSQQCLATLIVLCVLRSIFTSSSPLWALSASKAKYVLKTSANIDADSNPLTSTISATFCAA